MTTAQSNTQRRRSVWPLALAIGILALALLLILVPGPLGMGQKKINSTTIGASLNDIAELATEEYTYADVGKFDQEGLQVFGMSVPFTGRNFLVTYEGRVTAGIKNFEDIDVRVDDAAKRVNVTYPAVEVLNSDVNADSVEVYDQSMNPLNQLRVEDFTAFIADREKAAEDKAVEHGLLDKARDHATELLFNHVSALIAGTNLDGYAVNVEWK